MSGEGAARSQHNHLALSRSVGYASRSNVSGGERHRGSPAAWCSVHENATPGAEQLERSQLVVVELVRREEH